MNEQRLARGQWRLARGGGRGCGGIDIYEVTTASLFRMVICVHSAHIDLTLLF